MELIKETLNNIREDILKDNPYKDFDKSELRFTYKRLLCEQNINKDYQSQELDFIREVFRYKFNI